MEIHGQIGSSGPTYMSAGMLGACIYFMAVGWIARSRPTYMSAGTLGVHIYFIAVGWITHTGPTYISAGTLGVCIIISGPKHYMQLKDIILAKIGWNAICRHLTHMKICL